MLVRAWMFLLIVAGFCLPMTAVGAAADLRVVASHSILADVARNVAGDQAEVTTLIPVTSDPHKFVPTPSDLTAVAEADLVLINGVGYEEQLLDAIEGAGEAGNILNASSCVQIRPYSGDPHMDEHDDDHADDHADDDHADDDHADDDHADDHDDDHADDDHADDDHADDEHDDDHADDDHADDDHADDDHADDDHADDDHADDDHADDDHADDDHADDHDDDHADDDHADDDHADDHDDDEHMDDHADDDHADDDHAHEEDEHAHESDIDCEAQDAEYAAIVGDEAASREFEILGRGMEVECGGHDHGHDAHDDHGEAGGCDPHLWLDPHNVVHWVLTIRDALSGLAPDHADDFAANAAAYAEAVLALHAEVLLPAVESLPVENRVIVSGHESLGYLSSTYRFEIVTTVIPNVSTAVEPSVRDVAHLIDRVRDEGVPAIFSDIYLSDTVVKAIAAEAGVEVFGLYADTLSDADGPAATYLDYMRYNVSTLVEALQGDWR